jgi:hypothetical protein
MSTTNRDTSITQTNMRITGANIGKNIFRSHGACVSEAARSVRRLIVANRQSAWGTSQRCTALARREGDSESSSQPARTLLRRMAAPHPFFDLSAQLAFRILGSMNINVNMSMQESIHVAFGKVDRPVEITLNRLRCFGC